MMTQEEAYKRMEIISGGSESIPDQELTPDEQVDLLQIITLFRKGQGARDILSVIISTMIAVGKHDKVTDFYHDFMYFIDTDLRKLGILK